MWTKDEGPWPFTGIRPATSAAVPEMRAARAGDPLQPSADPRMAAYLDGAHHPGGALAPRIGLVAFKGGTLVGYSAGHLTTRHECQGEVQYLYVAPAHRRQGVGSALLSHLAVWFVERGAFRVCVNVNLDSPPALPFYRHNGAVDLKPYWLVWDDVRALATAAA